VTPKRPKRPPVVLVAAMAKDRTIGKDGKIPWHHSDDLRFFKVVTMGSALVMGRKTFDSIGRVLPGRDNIVVTRHPAALAKEWPAIFAVRSLDEAYALATVRGAKRISVIGGGEIYAEALPDADAMILSYVPEAGGGDVFFPEFDPAQWEETVREKRRSIEVVRLTRRRVR
jgi:dihydrofolate reductase